MYTIVGRKAYPIGTAEAGQLKVPIGQGVGGSNRSGAIPAFMDAVFQEHAIPWEEVPLSQRSKDFSPDSSFTACVHEVAIGHTDMCWANFWPTSMRSAMASFTSSLYEDEFVTVVHANPPASSFIDAFARPFEPFTWDLWVLVFTVFGLVGITLAYENDTESKDLWDFFGEPCGNGHAQGLARLYRGRD